MISNTPPRKAIVCCVAELLKPPNCVELPRRVPFPRFNLVCASERRKLIAGAAAHHKTWAVYIDGIGAIAGSIEGATYIQCRAGIDDPDCLRRGAVQGARAIDGEVIGAGQHQSVGVQVGRVGRTGSQGGAGAGRIDPQSSGLGQGCKSRRTAPGRGEIGHACGGEALQTGRG